MLIMFNVVDLLDLLQAARVHVEDARLRFVVRVGVGVD